MNTTAGRTVGFSKRPRHLALSNSRAIWAAAIVPCEMRVHIIAGEWGWLAYWKEPSPSAAFLSDLKKRLDTLFNPDAFPNVAALRQKWAEVEKEQAGFVNSLTNDALGKMLPFREAQLRLAHLMQHLANHSTYHRSQVSLLMRQLGAEPVATDFHVFLVEGRREAAP